MQKITHWFSLTLLLVSLSAASLQAKENVNTLFFKPSLNGKGLMNNESGELLGHLEWTVSLIANYAYKPVSLFDPQTNAELRPLISHRTAFDVGAALGVLGWLEFGLQLPVSVSQDGSRLDDVDAPLRKLWLIGDLRLYTSVRVLKKNPKKLSFSLQFNVTFPTADPRTALGDSSFTFSPMFNLSYNGLLYASVNIGATLRSKKKLQNLDVGQALVLNLGLGYTFRSIQLSVFSELSLASPFEAFLAEREESPLELDFGLSWNIKGFQLIGGAGVGLVRGLGAPAARVFLGLRYGSRGVAKRK